MNLFVAKNICWLKNCISTKLPNFCCEGKVINNIKILEEMQKLPEVERLRIICKVAVVMADENVEPGQFGKRKHNDTIDGLPAKYVINTAEIGAGTTWKIIDNYNISYITTDTGIEQAVLLQK